VTKHPTIMDRFGAVVEGDEDGASSYSVHADLHDATHCGSPSHVVTHGATQRAISASDWPASVAVRASFEEQAARKTSAIVRRSIRP